jgi:hypothetical protein
VAQRTTAPLCDKQLGEGPIIAGLHWKMIAAHRNRIVAADEVQAGYFRRTYGERWQEVRDDFDRKFVRKFLAGLRPTEAGCRELKSTMEQRVAGGWDYISQEIERQVAEGVRLEIAPHCGTL